MNGFVTYFVVPGWSSWLLRLLDLEDFFVILLVRLREDREEPERLWRSPLWPGPSDFCFSSLAAVRLISHKEFKNCYPATGSAKHEQNVCTALFALEGPSHNPFFIHKLTH